MKKLIMTDMDGTLLPLKQDEFIVKYFSEIARLFCEKGYDGKKIVKAIQAGSYKMFENDGTHTNEEVFMDTFSMAAQMDADAAMPIFDELYEHRFDLIKGDLAHKNPFIDEIVGLIREKSQYAVVATQPVFPITAAGVRLKWAGTDISRFDMVTSYDVSSYCKPNVGYYKEIMERFDAAPEETLMIGNDVAEDILPCKELGADTFLLTECLIDHGMDITNLRHGGYAELIEYLKTL